MSQSTPKNSQVRTIIAQGIIATMICVGGHSILYDPAAKALTTAKAEEAALNAQIRTADTIRDAIPQITAAMQKAKSDADHIIQTGRFAREEQELYAALTSLATKNHVRIDQMTPSKLSDSTRPAGQPASEKAESALNGAVAYTIDATATFGDLATFVGSLRKDLGYCIIKTVRLTPTSDMHQQLVHAFIETEHYSFDPSPISLTATDGGPN